MKLNNIISYVEEKAPISFQESYDNSGLILGEPDLEVSNVLICLDVDKETLNYAVERNCQLIISHHPAIFRALKNFVGDAKESVLLIKAIKNDIALYSSHTNFDSAVGGLSDLLCKRLSMENIQILKKALSENGEYGIGRFGNIEAMSGEKFLGFIKEKLSLDVIRYVGQIPEIVSKIAVYNGSYDSGIIEELIKLNPDALITGDLKYHDAQELVENNIFTIDAGHYGTEIIFVEEMSKLLENQFPQLQVLTYKGKDVFNYFK